MRPRHWLVVAAVVGLGLGVALAATTGSGTFRYEKHSLKLIDVYAYRGEASEIAGGRPTVLVFTTVPVDRAAVDGALDRDQELRSQMMHKDASWVELTVTPDGSSWVNAQISLPHGSQSVSFSGVGTVKLARHDASRIEGTFVTSAEEAAGDKEFNLTFAADIAPDPEPGEPLPAGGGEAGQAYVAYIAAVQRGDLDTMLKYMEKERAEGMAAARKEPDFAEQLDMFKTLQAKEVTVKGGALRGTFADLEVEGKDADGNRMAGKVRMVKDGASWRLKEESLTTYTQ